MWKVIFEDSQGKIFEGSLLDCCDWLGKMCGYTVRNNKHVWIYCGRFVRLSK